jgi:hypothetical protein
MLSFAKERQAHPYSPSRQRLWTHSASEHIYARGIGHSEYYLA